MKYPTVLSVVPQSDYSVVITFETGEIKKLMLPRIFAEIGLENLEILLHLTLFVHAGIL